ncbi:sensory transduction histidine kinase [Methanosarcina siciliae T4/M]|uniref:Sensory transduction histidine kinase n=1 Tax=Methanosarcina siciliae T4/M TaxID=1434120 RepID=A0A0E3P4F9_9EURY|nr:histidine kinase dimerization/phosphoacceptor domain -containing protein [Methanosarcina siciliae]AKB28619.1 sensory transduction histidine kinase [Methanosarcina siciliae T4/M]
MDQLVSKNPNPVLRAGTDGSIFYSNKAAEPLLYIWDIGGQGKLPHSMETIIKRVVSRNDPEKIEVKVGKKLYLIDFQPVPEKEFVNIYGLDISEQKKLGKKLSIKEKQYDALYTLGKMAFKCENLQAFMDKSVKLIAKTLNLEFCKILELTPNGNFLLKAGIGWKPGLVGKAVVEGGKSSQAGYTIFSKVPVIVRDFAEENRFEAPEILSSHNIASGVSVIIGDVEKPFGVLGAHSTKKRKFTAAETYFLNSVALVIAEVIEHRQVVEELNKYREHLEELVKERTSELTETNKQLFSEISVRKQVEKDLQNNICFLETILDAIPSPVFYRNLAGIYQGCNEMFAKHVLGLPKEKVIGHSMYEFREQYSEETLNTSIYYDRILLGGGKSLPHELKIKCADGKVRNFLSHKAIYSNIAGEVIGIVGVMLDITERKKAEETLLKTEEIRKKEIHHRIKNNLQVISSLLSLQAEYFSDLKVKESFKDSQNRVISMSLIHEELYKTRETVDVETFDFKAYIQKLANELFRSYLVGSEDIRLKLDVESAFLGMDTGIPLGIIVNELVSNSLKHAFPEGRSGEIQIKLHHTGSIQKKGCNGHLGNCEISEFLLTVSDNGIGFPEDFDLKSTFSLGLQLVNILVEQIEGNIELGRGKGTEFRIKFREQGSKEKCENGKNENNVSF